MTRLAENPLIFDWFHYGKVRLSAAAGAYLRTSAYIARSN
jgi:hypothetical protein